MTHPRQIGDWVADTRGRWALLVVLAVDDLVHRFTCAPDFDRPDGLSPHRTKDHKGNVKEVVVVRDWEAEQLREYLPQYMRYKRALFYTGAWEFIPLRWAPKDCDDAPRLPSVDITKLPLRTGETFAQPLQNGYPIWYFLTGQISRPEKIKALWQLHNMPYRRRATVEGLKSVQYANEYCHCESLVRCSANDKCRKAEGMAYLVQDKFSEDRLRYFHANVYRVIPCIITLRALSPYAQAQEVNGLTFVFDRGPEREADICELAKWTDPNASGTKRSIVLEGFTAALETEGPAPRKRESMYIWPIVHEGGRPATDDTDGRRKKFHPDYRRRSPLVPKHLQNPSPNDSEGKKKETAEKTEDMTVVGWKDEPLGNTTTTTVTGSASSEQDEPCLTEHIEDIATTSQAHVETEKPTKKKEATAWWNDTSQTTTTETGTQTSSETTTSSVTATVTEVASSSEGEEDAVDDTQDSAETERRNVLAEAEAEAALTPLPESDEECGEEIPRFDEERGEKKETEEEGSTVTGYCCEWCGGLHH
jgi:hypothetical protein